MRACSSRPAVGYAVVVVVVVALGERGLNPTHAIAGTTVVAAVLTVSLQSTLGNVVGGVALQLDGSIEVGDWIQLESGRVGRVAAIRWRHIVLDTRDGDAVVSRLRSRRDERAREGARRRAIRLP